MKILVLNYEYPPLGGGGGSVAKMLAEGYADSDHEVHYITMHFDGFAFKEVIGNVTIHRIKSIRRKKEICTTPEMAHFVLRAIPYALKLTKAIRFDVVHSHFIIPTSIVAVFLKRFRKLEYIISVHGSDVPGYNPDRFQFEHHFTKPLVRYILKNASHIIALSGYLKRLMLKNISIEFPIKVIPNSINCNNLKHYTQKENRILIAGRLVKRKGFQDVLKAAKELNLKDWTIDIAGVGPLLDTLKELAEDLDSKVVFHGWLKNNSPELAELYLRSKIFCLPSSHENSSIALLEAMMTKNAIITSNTTGCKESVENAGILVTPHDINQIKDALYLLINNPDLIDEYGNKAHKRVTEYFDWNVSIKKYLTLLSITKKDKDEEQVIKKSNDVFIDFINSKKRTII